MLTEMPTNEELMAQIEELKTSLATTNRKLREVEDFAQTHIGMDWGQAGTSVNMSHPNLSSDTVESGGGVVRQNALGMQIKITDTGDPTSVAFVREFATSSTIDESQTLGHITERGDLVGTNPRTQKSALMPGATHYLREEWIARVSTSYVKWELFDYPGLNVLGQLFIGVDSLGVPLVFVSDCPLYLVGMAADPDAAELYDGMIWYRSDTDKHRVRQNGATVSLATETIVTDHTGDTSDAHDASAISVLDAGGNFTGTDVEAVLAELATAGGGSMPMPPVVGTHSWHCIGTQIAAWPLGAGASATWPASNRAIYMPVLVTEDVTVVKLWMMNGAAVSGNVNMALYDSAGAQVPNSEIGSTAQAGTNVIQEYNITDVALSAGQYYIAAVSDNTTGTVFRSTLGTAGAAEVFQGWGVAEEASAFDLPATATFAALTDAFIPLMGISTRTLVT
jgi:hypothetical protein